MASKPKKQEKKTLTLAEKIEVIRRHEKGGIGGRGLAQLYGVGKTQIQNIINRKREYIEDFENNAPASKRRKVRQTGNEEINKLCWEFFCDTTSRLVPCTGPMIQEQALKFARDLGVSDFKASNGWLESFKKRHNIGGSTMVGESAGVDNAVVDDWKAKVPQIIDGYAPRDILNMDESGVVYKATSTKTLFVKGEQCSGGKQSKERVTLMLCSNMLGEKERPLVIGKSARPRCFKNIKTSSLPVTYTNNKKAWMTSYIFTDWLKKLDRKMGRQGRKVLLFMDNAPSHPDVHLRNITLKYFPPNTTSRLQPMDQGIIQTVKLKYRKQQINRILAELSENPTATGIDIAKKVNLLDAIMWIGKAWRETSPETIQKCFQKAGFVTPTVTEEEEEEGEDVEAERPPSAEMDALAQELFGCTVEELSTIDDDLATCETEGRDWSQPAAEILEDLEDKDQEDEEDDDGEVDGEVDEGGDCNIKNFVMFMDGLKHMKEYCLRMGAGEALCHLQSAGDAMCAAWNERKIVPKQTTMDGFLKKL